MEFLISLIVLFLPIFLSPVCVCVYVYSLLFYPTTDPSHKPINRVRLRYQGLCMTYIPKIGEQLPRVMVGHANAKISVYCMDECEWV